MCVCVFATYLFLSDQLCSLKILITNVRFPRQCFPHDNFFHESCFPKVLKLCSTKCFPRLFPRRLFATTDLPTKLSIPRGRFCSRTCYERCFTLFSTKKSSSFLLPLTVELLHRAHAMPCVCTESCLSFHERFCPNGHSMESNGSTN